ncbi:MAG TPA: hypothetical protein VF668_07915 [Pyrinomonadaceae bacterium]|jgi:cyanophycin synthetase
MIVRTEEEGVAAAGAFGGAVIVKPLDGRQGKGVSLNLSAREEAAPAFRTRRRRPQRLERRERARMARRRER